MSFKSSFKLLQMLMAALMLAALLGACGATNTPVPAATTAAPAATTAAAKPTTAAAPAATTAAAPAATTAAPVATTAAAVAASGTFRFREASEPKTLDPGFITDSTSIEIAQNLFEGLVELNSKLEVVPAAASALPTVSADGLTYTYKLKAGLKWNNGDPLVAKDFVYAWNRLARLGAKAEYGFVFDSVVGFNDVYEETDDAKRQAATVSGFKAIDDTTIEIKLRFPAAYFLTQSALWSYWPVNEKVVKAKGNEFDEKNPWSTEGGIVSNGPFILKEWKHDVSMRIEPNPNYTGTVKPSIAAVTVDIVKEDATAKLKYDNGELDDVSVPVSDIQAVKKDAKYKDAFKEVPAARISWLAFNMGTDNVLAKNLKVRQAFWYAIDRQLITDGALQGAGLPATVLLPKGIAGYKDQNAYPFSIDKAKATLKEAGYDTPEKLKALADEINNFGGGKSGGIAYNADASTNKAVFENIQQQLKTGLGLDIKLNPIATFKEFLKRRDEDKEFILYRGSWGADYPDPENFYSALFNSKAGTNQSNFKNAQYDELVIKGNTATSPAARAEAYQAAEKLLQDQAAYVPLFTGIITRLVRPTIQNYEYTPQQATPWKFMTIKK